jgi:hypothetical protein
MHPLLRLANTIATEKRNKMEAPTLHLGLVGAQQREKKAKKKNKKTQFV